MNNRNKIHRVNEMLYQNTDFFYHDISDEPVAKCGEQFHLFYDDIILLNDSINSIIDKDINRKNEIEKKKIQIR